MTDSMHAPHRDDLDGEAHHDHQSTSIESFLDWLITSSGLFAAAASSGTPPSDDPGDPTTVLEMLDYHQMFERSLVVQLLLDPQDGRIVDANPAAAAFYGYSRDVLRTMKIQQVNILSPEVVQGDLDKARAAQKMVFQVRHRLASGEIRDVEIHTNSLEVGGQTLLYSIIHDVSERTSAEAALHASEMRLRAIFDQSVEFIGLLEPDGAITEINLTGLQFTGLAREDVIGKPLWEASWWQEESRSLIKEAVELASRGERPRFELDLIGHNSRIVSVDFSIKPGFREDGSVAMLIPEARDISNIKRVINTLRETNQTLEAIVNSSPLPIIALDTAGMVTMWNPAAVSTFWWEAGEVLGRPFPLLAAQYHAQLAELMETSLKGDSTTNPEVQALRKDKSPIILSVSSSPLRDADENITGVMLILMDVTERLEASMTLAKSEEQLRALFEAMPDVTLVVDAEGVCLRAAPNTAQVLARDVDEIIGLPLDILFPPDETMRYEEFLHLALDAGQTMRIEYHSRLGQMDKWYVASITPMHGDELLWVARDVTDRKRFEAMQSALYQVARIAGSAEDMDSFYESLHSIVGELMYARNFYIALVGPRPGMMHFPYFVDEIEDAPGQEEPRAGLTGLVLDTGKPVLITDKAVQEKVRLGEISSVGPPAVDWMGVPLIAREETFGVLVVQSYNPDIRFDEDDLELLIYVSRHIASAIDRKRADATVRESEERYRTLIETSPDAVLYMDMDGIIEVVNPNGAQLFGFDSEKEMVGRSAIDLAAPEDADLLRGLSERLAANETVAHVEATMVHRDGLHFPAELSASLTKDAQAQPQGIVVILRDITERRRIEIAEKEQRELAEALRDTAAALNSTLDLNELLDRVLENVERVLPHDAANVIIMQNRICETVRWEGYVPDGVGQNFPRMVSVVDDYPNMLRIMETLAPHIIENTRKYSGWKPHEDLAWIASNVCAPIVYQGQVLGFLNVDSKHENFFTEDHARRLAAFADQVAVALQNTRLYESERKQLALSQTLQEVGALLTSQVSLQEVLEQIFDLLGNVVAYDAVAFLRVTSEATLEQVAARGQAEPGKSREFMEGQNIAQYERYWGGRSIGVVSDTQADPDWIIQDGIQHTRSWIGAALRVKGELIGILNVDSFTPNAYDESVAETVVAFANQAAIAIENARLYESEHRQRRIAELITDTTTAAVSSLDTGQVLLTMATRLREISGFDSCGIYDWDPVQQEFRSVAEQGRIFWKGNQRPYYKLEEYPVTERVLQTGTPAFIYAGSRDADPSELTLIQLHGLRTLTMYPLRSGDVIVGLVELGSTHGLRNLLDSRRQSVRDLLDQAASYLPEDLASAQSHVLVGLAQELVDLGGGQWCSLSVYRQDQQVVETLIEYSDLIWEPGEMVGYKEEDYPGAARAAHSKTIIVSRLSELAEDSAQAAYMREDGLGMVIHIPIISHGNAIGLVELSHVDGEVAVTEEDLHLWRVIVDQTAIALENARLYESEQRQRKAAEMISATTAAAASSLNPQDVLLTLAKRLRDLAGAHTSSIFQWDHEGKYLREMVEYSNSVTAGLDMYMLKDYPSTAHVLTTGEPISFNRMDAPDGNAEIEMMIERGFYSFMMLPLRAGDEIVGLVEIAHTKPWESPMTMIEQATDVLNAAADRVPLALLDDPLAGGTTMVDIAAEVVDLGIGTWCAISAWQRSEGIVQTCADYSALLWESETGPIYDVSLSAPRRALLQGETVTFRLSDPELSEIEKATLKLWGWRMAILFPITIKGQVIGMLEMGFLDEDQAITEPDQKVWRIAVDQAAVALENARLFMESRQRNEQLALLNQLTRTGTEVLDVKELLQTLADSANEIIGGTESYITLWDEKNRLVIPAAAYGALRDTYSLDPPSLETEPTITRAVLRSGRPLAVEDVHNHPDVDPSIAAKFPTKSMLGLPMIVDGAWLGAVLIGFDHTHHFTDEEIQWAMQAVELIGLTIAKAQAYEEMERRIETRTAELTAANERMQVLSKIRDEFVSNVSHELRTPITSIKLHHHLMTLRPENFETYMDRLIRETARLEHIVSDLLRLSELDRGQLELVLMPTDLRGLVDQYIIDRTLMAEDRGLKLTYESPAALPPVNIDAKLIGQSLSILLTNAIAYTPRGGQITVRTTEQTKEGQQWIVLSVSDTGPGISPEDMEQLFSRFFRGTTGRNSDSPGTGLGLAIAKEIADRHQGHMEAISEGIEGKGSTFKIWLPAGKAEGGTATG